MTLEDVIQRVQSALDGGANFDKTVKFDFGSIGKLFIDGINKKASAEDAPADATVSVDFEDFKKLAQGALDPTMAFMSGKLKIAGDMGVVMKLQSILGKLGG
ncbi:MAG: SCP2 sterol-binding domain-containing protein [Hyphomonadaceae bacterium]